jgi:lipid II:glycine glycyltransferase (peptidoglycan interpeptide bridge formation enzyme)
MLVVPSSNTTPKVEYTDLLGPSAEWDRFVATTPGGDLVQTASWAGFKRELGAHTHLMCIRRDETIVGGAVMHVRRVAPALRVAMVIRGPVLNSHDASLREQAIDGLEELARMSSAQVLVVQAPRFHDGFNAGLQVRNYRTGFPSLSPSATSLLDLRLTNDDMLAAAGKTRRKHLRVSLQQGFTFALEHDVGLFARLHAASAERIGFKPLQRATLEAQWRHLCSAGHVAMMIARFEGTPIAGGWMSSFGGIVTTKLAGWDTRPYQPKYVNDALNWESFQWARSVGADTFDLGGFDRRLAESILAGQPRPPDFMTSPSSNKASLGGDIVLLPTTRFKVLMPLVGRPAGVLANRMLTHDRMADIVARFRN